MQAPPARLPVLPSQASLPLLQTLGIMHTHQQLVHRQASNPRTRRRAQPSLLLKAQAPSQPEAAVPICLKAKIPKQVKQATLQTGPLLQRHLLVKGRVSQKALQRTNQLALQLLLTLKMLPAALPPQPLHHQLLLAKGRPRQKGLQPTSQLVLQPL